MRACNECANAPASVCNSLTEQPYRRWRAVVGSTKTAARLSRAATDVVIDTLSLRLIASAARPQSMDYVCRITGSSKGLFELATVSDACPASAVTTIKKSHQSKGLTFIAPARLAKLDLSVFGISACRQKRHRE